MPDLTPIFRLLAVPIDDKGDALRALVQEVNAGVSRGDVKRETVKRKDAGGEVFAVDPADFGQIPGSPFAYWVGDSIRRLFKTLPSLAEHGISAQHGASSKSDFRFLRLAWEVPPETIGKDRRWVNFAKGGQYSPYYANVHLLINWENDAEEIKTYLTERYPYLNGQTGWILHPENSYFHPGLTWPRRTTSGLSVRAMPSGCIFADKGPAAFVVNDQTETLLTLLAVMSSAIFETLFKLQLGAATAAARSYEVGLIQRIPIPDLTHHPSRAPLAALALEAHDLQRDRDRDDETTHAFCIPGLARHRDAPTLLDAGLRLDAEAQARTARLAAIQTEIDDLVLDLYGLTIDEEEIVNRKSEIENQEIDEQEIVNRKSEIVNEDEETPPPEDLPARVQDLLMWAVGVAFGRWDIRKALDPALLPPLGGPFDPLPRHAPGALTIDDERFTTIEPGTYDLRFTIDDLRLTVDDLRLTIYEQEIVNRKSEIVNLQVPKDGILVDDAGHPSDIVARVQTVLRLLWGERADAIEAEACDILGFKSLRDYFRDPRKGFFAFHILRYSKSRRKAPLYWLLQSDKRSYGVWLYCHRIRYDTFYAIGRSYVDAKRFYETGRLEDMREYAKSLEGAAQRTEERVIARQEKLVDELKVFGKTLDRIALLDLVPDLNDGVLISIAPLWELVPWKEPARAWESLVAGEYEWSEMAGLMRKKGIVKREA